MTRYLHRLIERATGQQQPLAATAPGESRSLGDDPFERVAEMPATMPQARSAQPAPPHAPAVHVEPPAMSAPLERTANPIATAHDAALPAIVTRVEREVQLAPPAPAPAPARIEPPVAAAPLVTADLDSLEPPVAPPRVLETASLATSALRPLVERETVTEKWLAPEPPPPVAAPPAPRTVEPERLPFVPPAPPVATVPPLRPVEPVAPPAAAAVPDSRPALTIGRLVVEVRQQAPAPAAAPVIVRAAAPASSAAPASVLHRGFGLGQS